MSNYTKTTNFATKDNLSPGNPLKIVKGTEIDTEYNNIATAVATKTDNSAAAITGGTIVGITDLAVADGGTGASTAAGALNNLLPSQTSAANKYLQSDGTNASWDAISLSTADITGTLPVLNGGTGVTTSTGTTNVVLSNSPTLVTPALGTPSAAVLTNATGLPISTGVSGLGTGVATFLGTPSSANLASAITDETGTGALVFASSPTLVTPALGTPSALVGTNITGTASGLTAGSVTTNANLTGDVTSVGNATTLTNAPVIAKVLTGYVSGAGTVAATDSILQAIQKLNGNDATNANLTGAVTSVGNATSLGSFSSANLLGALTDETGTGSAVFATSPTLVTPILGTPTSATLTNATGLPLTTGVTGLLPIANGGTATATPSIVAGTNVTVTGTWPNQTIAASSGGTPGGSTTQVQYNNAGAFGGITGATTDGTALTLVAPILGTPASGTVTNLTGTASININGTVGATTPAAGAFTSVTASTTLGVTGVSTLTGGAVVQGLTVGRGASAVSTNTAVGVSALGAITTAGISTSVGYQSGFSATNEGYNTFVGYQAGYSTTKGFNQFFGMESGKSVTTGYSNTILGAFTGNGGGLDIRTANNYAVISDGDGNPLISTANSQTVALKGAVPNSGTGITFPATQSASSNANTLDDYEEGTWTPAVTGGTLTVNAATYTKIGNQVLIAFDVKFTSVAAGAITITGLPFSTGGADAGIGALGGDKYSFASALTLTSSYFQGTTVFFFYQTSGANGSRMTDANITSDTTIRASATYKI